MVLLYQKTSHMFFYKKEKQLWVWRQKSFANNPFLQVVNKTDISVSVVKVYHGVDKSSALAMEVIFFSETNG